MATPFVTGVAALIKSIRPDLSATEPQTFSGDVNGDGRSDMIVQWANDSNKRQLLVYTANADGTYNAGINLSTYNTHNPNDYAGTFLVADVNGDGRDDFIVKSTRGVPIRIRSVTWFYKRQYQTDYRYDIAFSV